VQVTRAFRALGPGALLPLLALVDPDALEPLPPGEAREVLLVGALEAVGSISDRRATPVLARILDSDEPSHAVARAAAEALGGLCGDEELKVLSGHAAPGARRELEAIAGLGHCRRDGAAQLLVARLTDAHEARTARALALAMGHLGSSWAWQALGPARAQEGDTLRGQLVEALVRSFAEQPAEVQRASEHALRMLEHPSTAARVAEARAQARPEARAAFDRLEHLAVAP
jgi:hypothetical protein